MRSVLLGGLLWACIIFPYNIWGQQVLNTTSIQEIDVLYEDGEFHRIIEYVNAKEKDSSLSTNVETIKELRAYKRLALWKINNLAWQCYRQGAYVEAEQMLQPVIPEILDSITNNVYDVEFALVWQDLIFQYGTIVKKTKSREEALPYLIMEHQYVSDNLHLFLRNYPDGYSKLCYVTSWASLAVDYLWLGLYDEGVQMATDVLKYSKKECMEYEYQATVNLAHAYNETDSAVTYFKRALDIIIEKEEVQDRMGDYLFILRQIISLYNISNEYNKIFEALDYYEIDWIPNKYPEQDNLFIDINNTKAFAYRRLNYSIDGSREKTKGIYDKILNYYEVKGLKHTEAYIEQIRRIADSGIETARDTEGLYKKALLLWENHEKNGNPEYFALLKNYLVWLHGNYLVGDTARDNQMKCLQRELETQIPYIDIHHYASLIGDYYQKQARYYISCKEYDKAEIYNEHSLDIFEKMHAGRKEDLFVAYTDKACIMDGKNNWEEMDKCCNKILDLIQQINIKNIDYSDALGVLALNYLRVGNYAEGLKLFKEATIIRLESSNLREEDNQYDWSVALSALMCMTLEDKLAVCPNIIKSIEIENCRYSPSICSIYKIYASCLSEIGKYHLADSIFQQIQTEIELNKNEFTNAEYSEVLVDFYKNRANHECRKKNIKQAVTFEELAYNIKPNYEESIYLAAMYAIQNNISKYEQHIMNAVEGARKDVHRNFLYLSEDERKIYTENIIEYVISTCSELAYLMPESQVGLQKIYDLALFTKGVLLNSIREISDIIENSNNDTIISLYNDLLRQRNEIGEPVSRERLIKEKTILEYIRLHSTFRNLDYTWNDIRMNLKENECAVEFLKYRKNQWLWSDASSDSTDHYLALVLSSETTHPVIVDLFDDQVLKDAVLCGPNLYRNPEAKELHAAIWEKIKQNIPRVDRIYFSPTGLLNILNVESLVEDGTSYVRLSSTRELCLAKMNTNSLKNAVLYGGLFYTDNDSISYGLDSFNESFSACDDITETRGNQVYLPGTYTEVLNIKEILESAGILVDCRIGKEGTKESFEALSGNSPSILHIATHTNRMSNGVRSFINNGLYFSTSDTSLYVSHQENNFLSMAEISAMDLSKTLLTVLSACETGIGEITDDGVWGIQRAFKMAGANTIIMSLWKVDDAATLLMMNTFYKEFLRTNDKYLAMRKAQNEVKRIFENPYYWAGFIVLD